MSLASVYILIMDKMSGNIFRFPKNNNGIPYGFKALTTHKPYKNSNFEVSVYDKNGDLKPQFWGIKRYGIDN